jgi:methylmalonyl-CoA mutase
MDDLDLNSGFPAARATEWQALVAKVLKSGDPARLTSQTLDQISIQPLYTRALAPARPSHVVASGAATGWDIRQLHVETDPAAANAAILEDLAGGVTSIALQIAAPGQIGLAYDDATLTRTLDGVLLDVCPIHLRAGEYTPDAAGSLTAIWRARELSETAWRGAFDYDPIGTLARTGALYHPIDAALATAGTLAASVRSAPGVTALRVDGTVHHDAGASDVQELAAALSTLVAYLRAGERAGLAPGDMFAKIAVTFAVDSDQLMGIAKLRAARRLIARVADASSARAALGRLRLDATTSSAMLARRDPWVNILRTTMACAAASLGAADAITVLPFTWALGRPDAFARRIARNVQIILHEESGLGRVADPGAGSFALEALTDDLARAAWNLFQQLEGDGGIAQSLITGTWQDRVAKTSGERARLIATGRLELTGVSAFPKLGDDGITVAPWPREALTTDLPGARAIPMPARRRSEPFEALRDAADRRPAPPRLFVAALGELAQHAARVTWTRNFLAAGGIDAVVSAPLASAEDAAQEFRSSATGVVVICGSDALYAELGENVARALKAAGAQAVWLAGRPKDGDAQRLSAAGVDDTIHAGCDMLAKLERLHEDLDVGT